MDMVADSGDGKVDILNCARKSARKQKRVEAKEANANTNTKIKTKETIEQKYKTKV